MDDQFLNEMKRDPDPRFARELRQRLLAQGELRTTWSPRLVPSLAGGLLVGLVIGFFAFPSVRASAQAMLDLFRVRKFAAVKFDQSRIDKLKQLDHDKALMVFDTQETVHEPGPPQVVSSLEAAGAAAGMPVARPSYLPAGLSADTVRVEGAGEMRLSVSEAKLRALLDALDLHDVTVPSGIDGKVVDVRKPPIVIQQFRSSGGHARATLVQSNSPEIAVPAGMDIARLAEVGLRVLGLDPSEAHRVATTTDWRTTVLVPVPMNASTFREVTVRSAQGLMITTAGQNVEGERQHEGTIVLWSEGERVYAVMGNVSNKDLLQMAESVQ